MSDETKESFIAENAKLEARKFIFDYARIFSTLILIGVFITMIVLSIESSHTIEKMNIMLQNEAKLDSIRQVRSQQMLKILDNQGNGLMMLHQVLQNQAEGKTRSVILATKIDSSINKKK